LELCTACLDVDLVSRVSTHGFEGRAYLRGVNCNFRQWGNHAVVRHFGDVSVSGEQLSRVLRVVPLHATA